MKTTQIGVLVLGFSFVALAVSPIHRKAKLVFMAVLAWVAVTNALFD